MSIDTAHRAVAIVGVGAVLPDARDAKVFWKNICDGRYSIRDVPEGRWDPALYYDADHRAEGKTYSKIGGWCTDYSWDPLAWRLPLPPKVSDAMDRTQKWAIIATREALLDCGWPERPIDTDRTAVIFGNALAGDKHYMTALRIHFPEFADELAHAPSFAALPAGVRAAIVNETMGGLYKRLPPITEDTMPGELSNVIAGRVAQMFNLHGPNYVTDAACASAMAAITAAMEGLEEEHFDVAITGGIDGNMSAPSFVKFCKIGALSGTGTRPYADGADGFVMGEGAAVFVLKRLADAERDGDRVYAVIRGTGGSSDGRGKGITAPNPVGQKLAIERAWHNAGVSPETVTMIEGHGTSTRVGDRVEVESMDAVFGQLDIPRGRIALGSVKSNIGHLKGAAGAAGVLKAALSLHHKQLPPSINFDAPNPAITFDRLPVAVNTELRPWNDKVDGIRRAGVSAFGFGGTNFHAVLEEYVPGRIAAERDGRTSVSVPASGVGGGGVGVGAGGSGSGGGAKAALKAPLRGALVIGGRDNGELAQKLGRVVAEAKAGNAPPATPPRRADLEAPRRIAIDFGDAEELATKGDKALSALQKDHAGMWKALAAQGVFVNQGRPGKVAFLYTGQGSQYANMCGRLREVEPIVARVFDEADRVMTPLLGRSLSSHIFVDPQDEVAKREAELRLMQTEITQPAVLAVDAALHQLLEAYGVAPDMVMGHSLGEYGALVAAGALPFSQALEAVSARGAEMARVSVQDNGAMVAVFGPLGSIQRILGEIDGYVVVANLNSHNQAVVGGATDAVTRATQAFVAAGMRAIPLPVSHAFHTRIVAPASEPLMRVLTRMDVRSPRIPLVANVTGDFYPQGEGVEAEMVEILGQQIASPVQFVKGLETLYDAGVRVFVEVGPKKALAGLAADVLGDREGVLAIHANHPKVGDVASFNQCLCALYAAGLGDGIAEQVSVSSAPTATDAAIATNAMTATTAAPQAGTAEGSMDDRYSRLGRLFAEFLDRGMDIYRGGSAGSGSGGAAAAGMTAQRSIVVSGVGLGLPGTEHIFDDGNIARILHGESFIDVLPMKQRRAILDKHVTRLHKSESGARFETIEELGGVLKLAGRPGAFDLGEQYEVPDERLATLDITSKLAIAAGLDALRDAGIPLAMHYKTTTKGTKLPERWMLPEALRDDTGVIFGSAFPGYDNLADDMKRHQQAHALDARIAELEALRGRASGVLADEIARRLAELRADRERDAYVLDRKFLFRILAMGHSQLAEHIGARGPNTQINAACASGTQAVSLAQDWIRAGRCRRVLCVTADAVTSDHLMEWIGAGFLASGAAATDEIVEDAALPFDRRRHGLILGMGASGMLVESADAAAERGVAPIGEVLATATANSAFHGSRLDVDHITQIMEGLVSEAERTHGIDRRAIAAQTVFVSHETYTPARGGSAQAEIHALRRTFGDVASQVVIANTKGYTGHAMGAGVEDAVAIKMLESGIVPPISVKEIDPELGQLNLSRGGGYPVNYALRLAAGFGSQISMSLVRWVPSADGRRTPPEAMGFESRLRDRATYQRWLSTVSGYNTPKLERAHRLLRIANTGIPENAAAGATVAGANVPVPVPVPEPRAAAPAPATAPAAAAPAPAPAAPAPAPTAPVQDPVQAKVLEIVAAQTGYPPDMLDLDLDLEADLGIDTVKQAETFAAVRDAYNIVRDDQLKLRDFPTLNHVIGWVLDKRPDLATPANVPAAVPVPAPAPPAAGPDPIVAKVLAIVSEQTGYPPDMLDPELDLEADLGVDTVKQAETFAAVREAYNIERDDNLQLKEFPTLNHVIGWVRDKRPDLAAATNVPVPVPVSSAGPDPIEAKVLAIVAEQTGYPPDMLDLDLDLEADLGVDTVKQAETFAAVREAYDIERDENLQLKEFPTLNHVIGWVRQNRPDLTTPATTTATANVPVPEPATPAGPDPIEAKVLEIVAEQTGYPPEMLDLDLDLEADLGVDTVKQAETFAAVREAYNIERDENLQLKEFPTLNHVIGWVRQNRPDLAAPASAPTPAPTSTPEMTAPEPSASSTDAVPRRVPRAVLRPALELCKPTGIELSSGDRVIVMCDRSGACAALAEALGQRGVEVLLMEACSTEDFDKHLADIIATGPVAGVFWLPALDAAAGFDALDRDGWRHDTRVYVKLAYRLARALYEQLDSGRFFISATRLGGRHGYDSAGAARPLGGAVSGFTKALSRERGNATIKVVDFELAAEPAAIAQLLIAEAMHDPGACEVGYADQARWTLTLSPGPLPANTAHAGAALALGADTVYVVTGAAGSIVSAIVCDLARTGGTFHLLDLAPAPERENPDLARIDNDLDGLKRDLMQRLQAQSEGKRVTPVMVQKALASIERAAAAKRAMDAIEAAGGSATYHSLDLTDAAAVGDVMGGICKQHGRVDVLMHAAGLEISHFLPDKRPEEFDLVFDVKVDGWLNLLAALGETPLGAAVVFSSIAGRFGNGGQTDYSAANDLLCKHVSSFRSARPATRGIAIDWTAWRDIGMAARGSIPKMMELAGIDMLAPRDGVPVVRRELEHPAANDEIVVAQRLGLLTDELDTSGGLDLDAVSARASGPMTTRVASASIFDGFTVEATLDPSEQPFLYDHQIDGTPVLPGVMGIEAFAEAARVLYPDWHVAAIEDVAFLAPFKFYRNEPRTVTVNAFFTRDGEALIGDFRLRGQRALASGETREQTHFSARVRLEREPLSLPAGDGAQRDDGAPAVKRDDIYRIYFHGPAYRVLDTVWRQGERVAGLMPRELPANHSPSERSTVMAPRLIELCFQTAGVWEIGTTGKLGLPWQIDRVRTFRDPQDTAGLVAVVEPDADGQSFNARVTDGDGNVYVELEGYRTVELGGVDEEARQPLQAVTR